MLKVDFIDILLFVLFFQLLAFVPFLLFGNKKQGIANKILAAFLLAKALCITNFITFRLGNQAINAVPHLFYVGSSFTILWGPLLYLYTLATTNKNFKINKTHIIHFLPFIVHLTYLTFIFHRFDGATKQEMLHAGTVTPSNYGFIYYGFINLYTIGYLLASFFILRQYRRGIKEVLSSIESIRLNWLLFVLAGYSIKWAADTWLYMVHYIPIDAFPPLVVSRIALFLFLNIMIFKGLKQPVVFSGEDSQVVSKKRVSLSEPVSNTYLNKLLSYMEQNKPFMNPDLSLTELAEQSEIPPRSLSEVINISLGQNFYDFVNSYRIKESEKMLTAPEGLNKTVLEILYEVGFNSKSSFNQAFKKKTGMTPSQYKKSQNLVAQN